MNIADVRQAIADSLADLSINAYSYAPDAPISPAAYIYPDPFPYHPIQGKTDVVDVTFVVRFLVASSNEQAGQNQLDELISPTGQNSAIVAIESDTELGNLVSGTKVTDLRNYGVLVLPDQATRFLSAELLVDCLDKT